MKEPCFIVGLGPTSKAWDGQGFSIGVNDIYRRFKTTSLLCVNHLGYDRDRQKYIDIAKPTHGFYTDVRQYKNHPCYRPLFLDEKIHRKTKFDPKRIYYDNTSTFIAASLAFYSGFRQIVLVGVDFINHRNIKNNSLRDTVGGYVKLNECFKQHGGEMFLLVNEGGLKDKLRVYERNV